ncbi:MAG: ABC transporter ATP-binding protein [Melioribacteraceae bacterium]|nr:ABC transporter ATP-binding protein [Melioribacteraceae bacterium]
MNCIEINNLSKIFNPNTKKAVAALNDFNLSIPNGTIFGLLGPNGAGKTTLIKILLGITYASTGDAKILGEDILNYKVKRKVGYLPESHKYPPYLTGEQVLKFYAKLSGYSHSELDKRIEHLLKQVKMNKWKNTKVKAYSKGMMQRLGLAQAMVNDPELIFLDEPTDGVDPIGRKEIRDILFELKNEGKSIFLNSHLLSEVEMVTDRVAILDKGVLLKEGTVEELTTDKEIYNFEFENFVNANIDLYKEQFSIIGHKGSKLTVTVNDTRELNKLLDRFRNDGVLIKSVVPQKNTLEDMFISLIKESEENK